MNRPRIAILASGGGTTAEAFVRAGAAGQIDAAVGLVICNNKHAGVFQRVADLNKEFGLDIQTAFVNGKTHPAKPGEKVRLGDQTQAEEAAITQLIKDGGFDLVALMGYMKRVGSGLVHEFGWRPEYAQPEQAMMVNTHPGLLPETKGLYGIHVQEYVLRNKLAHGGQTLHVVAEDYDDGPTIAEHKIAVKPGDTPETFFDNVQKVEKQYLPMDIDAFIRKRRKYLKARRA